MTNEFERCGNTWAQGLYPYTVIAYRFGKRLYLEYKSLEDVYKAFEERDAEKHSVALIITPSGEVYSERRFVITARKYGGKWEEVHV